MRERDRRKTYNITGGIPRLIGVSLEKDRQTERTKGWAFFSVLVSSLLFAYSCEWEIIIVAPRSWCLYLSLLSFFELLGVWWEERRKKKGEEWETLNRHAISLLTALCADPSFTRTLCGILIVYSYTWMRALGFFILLWFGFGGELVRALPFYYFVVTLSRENLTLFCSRKVQKGIDFSLFRDII